MKTIELKPVKKEIKLKKPPTEDPIKLLAKKVCFSSDFEKRVIKIKEEKNKGRFNSTGTSKYFAAPEKEL